MGVVELVCEPEQLLAGAAVVGLGPGATQAVKDRWPVALGQVPDDVPFFVPLMATSP